MSTPSAISCWLKFGILSLRVLGLALLISPLAQGQEPIDFVKSIKPIFEAHCLGCHGAEEAEAFRIDVKDEAMDYIVPESAGESDMYLALISDDEEELMPPPDEDNPLSKEQILLVKTWIDQGANWPDDETADAQSSEKKTASEPGADEKTVDEKSTDKKATGAAPVVPPALAETKATDNPAIEQKNGVAADNVAPADEVVPAIDPKTQRLFNATGSLHPAAVHLPIGLLLAAGLFALFSLRGNFVMSDCAYYCLWLGTLGAIVACVTGWWFSPMENRGTVKEIADLWNDQQPVYWHRTSALVATAFAFLLALFAASARNRDPDDGMLWKFGCILLALGIGWVGHEGGELTHGKQHYKDLKAIGADLFPSVFGDAPEVPAAKNPAENIPAVKAPAPVAPVDDNVEIGDTSDET